MKDKALREHVRYLLGGGGAHLDFGAIVDGLAPELRGVKPPNMSHTPWQILEHLRLAKVF